MTELETAIIKKEAQILSLQSQIESLMDEVEALKRAKAILSDKPNKSTMGDAVRDILQEAGTPLHTDIILKSLNTRGLSPSKKTMISVLRKDKRNRFVENANHVFALNPNPKPATILYATQKIKKVRGLAAAMRIAIRAIGDKEFKIGDVIEQIASQNPSLGEQLKANSGSVSATLKRMETFGELEIIKVGKGPQPNVYKAVSLSGSFSVKAG